MCQLSDLLNLLLISAEFPHNTSNRDSTCIEDKYFWLVCRDKLHTYLGKEHSALNYWEVPYESLHLFISLSESLLM
jgi:hypothetical protein